MPAEAHAPQVSEFPGRPRLRKGTLAIHDDETQSTPSREIVFQYNPEQVRRSLQARQSDKQGQGGGGGRGNAREDVLRIHGPPVETFNLSVALDAADQLEAGTDRVVNRRGLLPALSALELLMYPRPEELEQLQRQAESGRVQVGTPKVPLVLLAWNESRIVPVALTSFSVTEELFDADLNPIRAKVEMALKVLTVFEFPPRTVGADAYMTYLHRKAELAAGRDWDAGGAGGTGGPAGPTGAT